MTQDEAFLQAIREAPEDDAPRLIYADWLEEHGQADRAEFIRIQCRIFGLSVDDPAAVGLLARAQELLRNNWHAWVDPIRELVGPMYERLGEKWLSGGDFLRALARFRRGFVDSVTMDAERFLAHAADLLALVPLRDLRLQGAGRCAQKLFSCPHLAGLRTLVFSDYWRDPLSGRDVLALAACPYLEGLTGLYLGWNSLGDDGVEVLTRASWLTSVVTLDLSDNGISDAGAFALAYCPHLGRLQNLYLRRNSISSRGRTALASSPCLRNVTTLELQD